MAKSKEWKNTLWLPDNWEGLRLLNKIGLTKVLDRIDEEAIYDLTDLSNALNIMGLEISQGAVKKLAREGLFGDLVVVSNRYKIDGALLASILIAEMHRMPQFSVPSVYNVIHPDRRTERDLRVMYLRTLGLSKREIGSFYKISIGCVTNILNKKKC